MCFVRYCCSFLIGVAFLVSFATPTWAATKGPASVVSTAHSYKCLTDPCDRYQIVWTGDVLLDDSGVSGKVIEKRGAGFPFAEVHSLLSADYVIGNCEGPITTRSQALDVTQRWTYNMAPKVADVLREVGFSAVGLANNHVFDRGVQGFADSQKHLQDAGLAMFGAGNSAAMAHRPLLIATQFGKVGVVAFFHNIGRAKTLKSRLKAGRDKPGTAWLTKGAILRARKQAQKLGAKWVVGFVHWGTNYKSDILRGQTRAAAYFSEAGYDLVIGHGPHTFQRVERVGRTWILYSLGNFVFTTAGRYAQTNTLGHSLVARTYLGPTGFERVELSCITTDNAIVHYQPRACTGVEQTKVFMKLGPDVHVEEGLGHVRLSYPSASSVPHAEGTVSPYMNLHATSLTSGLNPVEPSMSVSRKPVTKSSRQKRRRRQSALAANNTIRQSGRRRRRNYGATGSSFVQPSVALSNVSN